MTLPKEIEHDLETLSEHWPQAEMRIRAHLLSQDAEIERLNRWILESHKATRKAFLAERSRLAAADALLRFMRTRFDAHMDDSDRASIDAHLQGAGDEV